MCSAASAYRFPRCTSACPTPSKHWIFKVRCAAARTQKSTHSGAQSGIAQQRATTTSTTTRERGVSVQWRPPRRPASAEARVSASFTEDGRRLKPSSGANAAERAPTSRARLPSYARIRRHRGGTVPAVLPARTDDVPPMGRREPLLYSSDRPPF
eukprot:3260011-Lingulodinium_polyedra.AAC.1